MTKRKKKVLIICTGNSCRSQMAEGWVRHDLGDRVEVHSAGTTPYIVHPLAIQVMGEAGVDISGHRSKSILEFQHEKFDLVITVCDSARQICPSFPGAVKQVHESIADPFQFGGSGDIAIRKFRESRDLIRDKIESLIIKELELD